MITIIADDITGAAEMAGIGFRFGLRTSLITEVSGPLPDCDILVFATDTRSMTETEAVAETKRVAQYLWECGAREFFKKTDSALRGHVTAELKALLEETPYSWALYLPENPSKGRVVNQGVYYINGQPLHETSFAFDPEFPAYTSVVTDRLPGIQHLAGVEELFSIKPTKKKLPIYIADAESDLQIGAYLANTKRQEVLYAGAADLFTAYLRMRFLGSNSLHQVPSSTAFDGLQSGKAIIVCGSTQSTSLSEQSYVKKHSIPTEQMPLEVFEGAQPATQWIDELKTKYAVAQSMILTIGYPSKGGKEFALRLRNTLADVVNGLIETCYPEELVIEGGATAFTILKQLGWKRFRLTDEVAPGVVRMQWAGKKKVHITLKPGSYPWGGLFGD